MLLANLLRPSAGSITIGGRDLNGLPQAVTGRRISYVGQEAYLFPTSVRDNLLYGLNHRPRDEAPLDEAARKIKERDAAESQRAGNTTLDAEADWIDYSAAGAKDADELQARMIETLSLVDLEEDIYLLGLTGSIDPQARPAVAEGILRARAALLDRLADEGASDLVVHFDPERYNHQATLAENLLFGTPIKDAFAEEALAENPLVLGVLEEVGWLENLLEMGATIAKTMVELFAELPPGHPFFEQFGFINEEDLPEFQALVGRAEKSGPKALAEEDQLKLRRLPFKYIDGRHRLSLITKSWEASVLVARRRIAERLERSDLGAVEFYRPDKYNSAGSLQDNILFGRLAYGKAHAGEIVGRTMTEVLDGLGLRQTVTTVGLDYEVGIAGRRLTNVQRQKLAIARALVKRPDLLIINEAASVMDGATQTRLGKRILEARRGRGVVWTLQRPTWAKHFDRVLVMQAGRQIGEGTFEDLNEPGSALGELVAAG